MITAPAPTADDAAIRQTIQTYVDGGIAGNGDAMKLHVSHRDLSPYLQHRG